MSKTEARTLGAVVGQTLHDLGVGVVTWVPGLGVTACAEAYGGAVGRSVPPSFHEEVAVGCGHGAALAGTRSAVAIKTHGLFKAANAVSDALFCGTTAAFVLVVVDDLSGIQSDSIVAAGPVLDALEVPWISSGPATIGPDLSEAATRSESLGSPVALVVDAAEVSSPAVGLRSRPIPLSPPSFRRDPARHLLIPPLVRHQRTALTSRLAGDAPPPSPSLPRVPEGVPPSWRPALERYGPVFDAFVEHRPSFVAGDIGLSSCYGLPPYDAIDAVSYMGGAVPIALGASLSGHDDAWAVTGDFSFVAAGHLGLLEAVARDLPLRVLLLANGMAETTGGQPVTTATLGRVLAGYHDAIVSLEDPLEQAACREALEQARARDGLSIVVARYAAP